MNVSRTLTLRRCFVPLCLFAFATQLHAQSLDAAARPAEIAVTGGYVHGTPDYGPDYMQGVSFGAMFTRYFHFPVAPSLEARYNIASTSYIKESTFGGGLRLQGDVFRRFHPYGDFLAGSGKISFKFPVSSNYTSDNSLVFSYGGGVGIDVIHNIQLTGDFQRQNWNLGTQHGGSNALFHPTLLTLGIKYTIPFHSYVGASGHHKHDQ